MVYNQRLDSRHPAHTIPVRTPIQTIIQKMSRHPGSALLQIPSSGRFLAFIPTPTPAKETDLPCKPRHPRGRTIGHLPHALQEPAGARGGRRPGAQARSQNTTDGSAATIARAKYSISSGPWRNLHGQPSLLDTQGIRGRPLHLPSLSWNQMQFHDCSGTKRKDKNYNEHECPPGPVPE